MDNAAPEAEMVPHDESPDDLAGDEVEPDHTLDVDSFEDEDEDEEVDE